MAPRPGLLYCIIAYLMPHPPLPVVREGESLTLLPSTAESAPYASHAGCARNGLGWGGGMRLGNHGRVR
jgi:hypothetical protein